MARTCSAARAWFFMIMFFRSLVLGFLLIILQVDKDRGDDGQAITILSGEVIPAVSESRDQIADEQNIQLWVERGKIIFFFVSTYILIFWLMLTFNGLPTEWADKGYTFLLYIYAYGEAEKNYTYAAQDFAYGDYHLMAKHFGNMLAGFAYIYKPLLVSFPYAGFIGWVLQGRKLTDDS